MRIRVRILFNILVQTLKVLFDKQSHSGFGSAGNRDLITFRPRPDHAAWNLDDDRPSVESRSYGFRRSVAFETVNERPVLREFGGPFHPAVEVQLNDVFAS